MNKQVISVSFDSLFDTRLGVMDLIDPKAAEDLLSDAYYQRRSDDFSLLTTRVTDAQFKEAYKNRSVEVLKRSRMTSMFRYLQGMLKTLELGMINSPFVDGIEVEFNAYPYKLNSSLVSEFIKCFQHYFTKRIPMEIVYLKPSDLNTQRLKARYSLLIMYDFLEWLDGNIDSFKNQTYVSCPGITMMIPDLLTMTKEQEPEMQSVMREVKRDFGGMDIFKATELFYCEFFGLKFNEVGLYCIVPPYHKDRPANAETPK